MKHCPTHTALRTSFAVFIALLGSFAFPVQAQEAGDAAWAAQPRLHLHVSGVRAVGAMDGPDGDAMMMSVPRRGFGVGLQAQLPLRGQWLHATAGLSYMQIGVSEPMTHLRVPDEGRVERGWRAVPLLAGLRAEGMPSPLLGFYASVEVGAAALTPPVLAHDMLGRTERRRWDTAVDIVWAAGFGMLIAGHIDTGVRLFSGGSHLYEGSLHQTGEDEQPLHTSLHFSTLQFVLGVRL